MSGHTPGPWEVCGHDVRGPYAMGDSERPGLHVCTVAGGDKDNAHLIAAAPELLAACRKLVEWHGNRAGFGDDLLPADQQVEWVADAMRAISKATGEQP